MLPLDPPPDSPGDRPPKYCILCGANWELEPCDLFCPNAVDVIVRRPQS